MLDFEGENDRSADLDFNWRVRSNARVSTKERENQLRPTSTLLLSDSQYVLDVGFRNADHKNDILGAKKTPGGIDAGDLIIRFG